MTYFINVAKNDTTSAIIDGFLRFLAVGGLLTTAVLLPNAVQALDKPLKKYFDRLDKRSRDREYNRIVVYMKSQGLVSYGAPEYKHGVVLTDSGRSRLKRNELTNLRIRRPETWDKRWRVVFFDIPQSHRYYRDRFSRTLLKLGLVRLQKSVWIHPFPCREEVGLAATSLGVDKYTTYIESSEIDNEKELKSRFSFKF